MLSPSQIKAIITTRNINYKSIEKHQNFIKDLRGTPSNINFFVPVRGRTHFFSAFIKYAKNAASMFKDNVRFVIIENDTVNLYKNLCKKENLDYIFIPSEVSYSEGAFAKALCYNMGFLLIDRAEWNIFHDLDILIDSTYFIKVKEYLDKNPTWLQPFSKKRVFLLNDIFSKDIIKNSTILDFNTLLNNKQNIGKFGGIGAPGGSIAVRTKDFINIGGYDPELFFGYSPEDSFFWTKLEILYGSLDGKYKTHFQGKAVYADNPPINIYHMYHDSVTYNNIYYWFMLDILHSFWGFSLKEKKEIVSIKSYLFKEFLK